MRKIFLLVFIFLIAASAAKAAAIADTAKSACLMNAVTGEVLFEKNSGERLPMASTTKIMTLLVALEESKQDETVTVSHEADYTEGSSAYIEEGSEISMEALEYGLMLNSGNDAAVAIAEHISGSPKEFAERMNKTARKIGVKNTHFMNPNGLDEENHYTTAYDLAKITQYALTKPEFREIVSTRLYTAEYVSAGGEKKTIEYINHNRLLKELDGCIGVKTGYTKEDGRCLVSASERDGARYIAVTLNDSNDWKDHKELTELAFSGCHIVNAVKSGDCIEHLKSGKATCDLIAADDFYIPLDGDKKRDIDIVIHLAEEIGAVPLNKGEKAGYMEILCNDISIGTVDIAAKNDFTADGEIKEKPCFIFTIINMIKNML